MPLRFSSLRRGLLLVAVNHEKGEPHKHSEALGFIYSRNCWPPCMTPFINASLAIFLTSRMFGFSAYQR